MATTSFEKHFVVTDEGVASRLLSDIDNSGGTVNYSPVDVASASAHDRVKILLDRLSYGRVDCNYREEEML